MARTRSPAYDDQREMILAHAADLFARRGYPATSMNQLAEACGLSKPTLYHYYRDKYALLVQIAEGHVGRLAELVAETVTPTLMSASAAVLSSAAASASKVRGVRGTGVFFTVCLLWGVGRARSHAAARQERDRRRSGPSPRGPASRRAAAR